MECPAHGRVEKARVLAFDFFFVGIGLFFTCCFFWSLIRSSRLLPSLTSRFAVMVLSVFALAEQNSVCTSFFFNFLSCQYFFEGDKPR